MRGLFVFLLVMQFMGGCMCGIPLGARIVAEEVRPHPCVMQ